MNAEMLELDRPMSVIERATKALNKEESEAEIKALVEESKHIVAVTNPAERTACHKSMMTLKNLRTLTQRRAKAGRDEAVQFSKAVIAIENDLVALISPEEERLLALRDDWDSINEREREAAIQAEQTRVEAIRAKIEAIRNWPVHSASSDSMILGQMLSNAEAFVIDPEVFEEFTRQANDALMVSRAALGGLLATRKEQDAKEVKLKADLERLAKLEAEQAERDRVAKEAQAKADEDAKVERGRLEAIAKAEREVEAAKQAHANKIERERIAAEEAAAKIHRDAEEKRLADIRAEDTRIASERRAELDRQEAVAKATQAAEAKRLADERAQFEKDQAAAIEAAKPKPGLPNLRTVERPSTAQLVACIAGHYSVSTEMAAKWLRNIKWVEFAA